MPLPQSYLLHLQTLGYSPRSGRHSGAICRAIVEDLMAHCQEIRNEASAGRLVFEIDHHVWVGHTDWKTDLAIGPPPPGGYVARENVAGMDRATPAVVRIAVEAKSIMTEHIKQRKNRKRDLEAHHAHIHAHDPQAIAASITVVNAAEQFRSPTRPPGEISIHKDPMSLADRVLDEVRNVTMAGGTSPVGLDAKCALVLDMDNINHLSTRFVTAPPAPQPGNPMHWDSFIRRICDVYRTRFV